MGKQQSLNTVQGQTVPANQFMPYASHHKVLIVGAGSAGLTMAAMLAKKMDYPDVAVIDPSESHYYQPLWTLIGAGVYDKEKSLKPMAEVIPDDVTWIKDAASTFFPEQNMVTTQSGKAYSYEQLIVAPGIQINWDGIPGLLDNLGKNGVCSNYSYRDVEYTHKCMKSLQKGDTAIFTQPATPIKCGGAPQKIMYLTCDHLKNQGRLNDVEVLFNSAGGIIFGVPDFAKVLNEVIDKYGLTTNFKHNLVAIHGDKKEADFVITKEDGSTEEKTFKYDMLHVTPPMQAPEFVKNSSLSNEAGWVEVDKETLQHVRYSNVFSLGDVASTPNAKTGAAVRKQAQVLGHNMMQYMKYGEIKSPKKYNGYGSCPLITGYGKTVLAEFDYDNNPTPSFPFDQARERWDMYMVKKHGIPFLYWNLMIKGNP
jgi:sulfide:quinone oxidoreductase